MHARIKLAIYANILALYVILFASSATSLAAPGFEALPSSTTYLSMGMAHRMALFTSDLPGENDFDAFAFNSVFFGLRNDWSYFSLQLVGDLEFNAPTIRLSYDYRNGRQSTSFVFGVGLGLEFSFHLLSKVVDILAGVRSTVYFIQYNGGFFAFDARLGIALTADRRSSSWLRRARLKLFAAFPVYSALEDVFSIEFFEVSPGIEIAFDF